MKYFNNITTAEELKKEFRALSIKLHPDRGGNAEDFAEMLNEYETICKDFDRIKEQEEARKEAEEERKRWEQEEAERKAEEERKAKEAREALRPIIAQWSGILEQVPEAPDYCASAKDRNKYTAAVKRNLKAVFAHFFPGVKVSVSISNKAYYESTVISWVDGPTVEEVEAVNIWGLFTGHVWTSDPYADYGHYTTVANTAAWREKFGSTYNDITFTRVMSEQSKEAINKAFEAMSAEWGEKDEDGKITRDTGAAVIDSRQIEAFCVALGSSRHDKNGDFTPLFAALQSYWNRCDPWTPREDGAYTYKVYKTTFAKIATEFYIIPKAQQEAAQAEAEKPHFTARHNETYKAIIKALNGNKFVCLTDGKDWDELTELTPTEAAEKLAQGEHVGLAHTWDYDGERKISRIDCGGLKTCIKRREKFAAVGFGITTQSGRHGVIFGTVNAETLAELRKDAEEVEAQRKAWEEAQKQPKSEPKAKTATASEPKTETTTTEPETTGAAPEGLELVEISEGVAIVGSSRATYKNRKAIKAHGARWNKDAQQWQATTAEAVAALREWFGLSDKESEPQQEPTTEDEPTAKAEKVARPYIVAIEYNSETGESSVMFVPETDNNKYNDVIEVLKESKRKGDYLALNIYDDFHGLTAVFRANAWTYKMLFFETLPDDIRPAYLAERDDLEKWAKAQQGTTAEDQTTAEAETMAQPDELNEAAAKVAGMFADFFTACEGIKTEEATETATEAENVAKPKSSKAETQDEPQREKIRFSWDDVPDLDELKTA